MCALIVEGSLDGNFSGDFQGRRERVGTAVQLAGVLALGRVHTTRAGWCRASLQVLHGGHRCVGFTLLTWLPGSGPQDSQVQISLFKVANTTQSRGLGQHMLAALLAQLSPGCTVQADCLPASVGMQRLLRRHGFVRTGAGRQDIQRWCRRL